MAAVICVYRGGRHVPFGFIDRLADLVRLAMGLKLRGASVIAEKVVAGDFDRAVVPPLFGIADLVANGIQLDLRFFLGCIGHPWQRGYIAIE